MASSQEVWWSEHKFYVPPLANFVLTGICYAVGIYLSSKTDAVPLARSGALATAISVGFTLWRYSDILANGNARARDMIKRQIARMNLTYVDPDVATRQVIERLNAQTKKIERRITLAQACVLIIATLVWGFGDLATALL